MKKGNYIKEGDKPLKFQSIRSRMIQFMLLATTIPLLLSISITYIHTKETIKEQALEENQHLIFQGKTNLNNYLDNINKASLVVYTDTNFLRNLRKIPDDYRAVAEVYTLLQNIQNTINGIERIYLHGSQSNQSTLVTPATFPKREFRAEPYVSTRPYEKYTTSVEPSHKSHDYGFPPSPTSYTKREVFTFHRTITNIPSEKVLGVLAIDVRLDAVAAICEQLFNKNTEQLLVVDQNGNIIYSGREGQIGQQLQDKVVLQHIRQNQSSGSFENGGAMHVFEKMQTPYAEWTIIKRIPNATLYERATQLTQINTAIAVIALLVIVFGTLFISVRITEPIKRLTSYMNRIQSGQLNVDIDWNSRDETGIMFARFRQMMDTINNLILREYRLELANKTNQLKALQAQINPHFLYNTLQSIGTLALQNNVPRIYALLSSLAKIMRYSMNNNDALVTLREEAEHVRLYLDLQKERFGEQLEFSIRLAPETLRVPMPKMILQPLVENYFKHGLDTQGQQGRLDITSRMKPQGILEIIIENNGESISPEALKALQRQLERQQNRGAQAEWTDEDGIGLHNVLMRLQLYTEHESALHVDNIKPQGVRITVEIHTEAKQTEENNE
ncbi:cache domain-containing sensor histidine kinase [Paenibacillus chibensis]|uniref:cache domain-containing sensor histidine kinase n=1 Tax=Paenibacillus chibensis TaxID=59846 RepID=UPI000FDBC6B6|nr:sensor histidine kinase [Paenibacillus chibensis]MEC0370951.1 sensor histidine kinase [Paenibacillus chibensis]